MPRYCFIASVCLIFASLLLPLHGQNIVFGSLTGTMTDSAGAVVPGAKIILVNTATGDRREAVTSDEGYYQFLNLMPATYRLDAEAAGFKRFVRSNVLIEVNRVTQIDIALEVGAVSETVEVTAATPLLDPQTSSLGQVVDGRKVRDLPLNGRNPLALVALAPGVVPQGGAQRAPAGQNFFAWGNFQIGGGATNQAQAYLDGAPLNLNYANLLSLVPTQDSLAEFKVQTNALSAEFGRTSGGVINLATRSGANAFHGTLYEFLRNRSLNANTFFNNRAGVDRPPFVQNQYGATVSGPIVRDRLFFMGNWEGFRQRVGRSLLLTVPTAQMRSGDFSNYRDANGNVIPIYDPLSVCGRLGNPACPTDANGNEVISRQQFPGNVIPANRLNPASLRYQSAWALPNTTGVAFTNVNNYITNPSSGADADWFTVRSDWNVSANQRIYGRYSRWSSLTLEIDPFGTHFYPSELVQGSPEDFVTHQILIADTYTFSPTTVADLRVSWIRQRYDRTSSSFDFDLTELGWPSFMNTDVSARFLPAVSVQGVSSSSRNTGSYIRGRTEDRNIAASLTRIQGTHSLKFGGELRVGPFNYIQLAAGSGFFAFDRVFTASRPFNPTGGAGYASFLVGTPASGDIPTTQPISGQQIYSAFYAQDDWRVTRRLTLNLGIRYDLAGPWSERYDRLSLFLPDAESPLASQTGLPLKGKFVVVNSPDRPSRTAADLSKKMFAPRLGLAFALNQKTVLRAGYGLFWIPNQVVFSTSPNNNIVNSQTNTLVASIDGITPFSTFNNPFPAGLVQPAGNDPSFESRLWGFSPATQLGDNPDGYMQQWNFNVQRQLPFEIFVDAAYAGSKGTHLPVGGFQQNQLPLEHMSLGQALFQQVPNPFFGIVSQGGLQAATVSRGQLLRPYPQFTGLVTQGIGIGTSNYHSFQLKAQRRFQNGASILVAYTAAKLISIGTDSHTGWLESETGGVSGFQNFHDFRNERALSSFDVPQRFVASFALDLPFGRGKHIGSSASGIAGKLISGWGLEGIVTFQSGFPLRLTSQPNTTNSFGGGSRPNSNGASAALSGPAQERLGKWFDTSAFSAPAPFTFGNASRTLPDVRAHGINNWDVGLFKNTPFGPEGRLNLQFRAEFFNLANRVQFGFPGQALGNPQFGIVSTQVNEPRLAQLALRFSW